MQTVYEAVKKVFEQGYDGTKVIVFESEKSRVFIERSKDLVYVYVNYNNKVLSPRWQCGFLSGMSGWKTFKTIQRSYRRWVQQIKECV